MEYKSAPIFLDEFTALFTSSNSIIADKKYPLGYFAAKALNMNGSPGWINKAFLDFKTEFQIFLASRSLSAAAIAQEKYNLLLERLSELPVYDQLPLQNKYTSNLMADLYRHPKETDELLIQGTERNQTMEKQLDILKNLSDALQRFLQNTFRMLDDFFEDLPSRRKEVYAETYSAFQYMISDALYRAEDEFGLEEMASFRFSFPVRISFESIYLHDKKKFVLAEKMYFQDIVSFLYADLYKGIASGNIPRRCHNCGRFFLVIGAYDALYCNEIAPGETTRTCRAIGAHKKEKLKTLNEPVLKEYNRVYNRLKSRKNRGVISEEEWNQQVGYIADLKDAALRGEYSDAELKQIYDEI